MLVTVILMRDFTVHFRIPLTNRPPAIMAVIATAALTAAIPSASAIAWKPTWIYRLVFTMNEGFRRTKAELQSKHVRKITMKTSEGHVLTW